MIKLIATDIDGTLYHSDHTQPAQLQEMLKRLKDNNIIFAIASGRPYLTLYSTFKNNSKDILFIAENGAHVVYQGKELSVHTLDAPIIQQIIAITRTMKDAYLILCTTEGAYVEGSNPAFIRELEKYYVKYTVVPDLTQVHKHIIKLSICDLAGSELNSYPKLRRFQNQMQISVAGFVWLDMMPKGVNKGEAIKEIQAALNLSDQEIMAFGDYLNDAEMLKSVYYSYAMENSHPDILKIARFQAASNDDDGVILKIKEMLNNNLNPPEMQ